MSATQRARELRSRATDAEQALWRRLRGKRMSGYRFRRQVPIGPYIVDFLCPSAKLIVEVDGGQHAENAGADARRTQRIESEGYRVMRARNTDALANPDGAVEAILLALRSAADDSGAPSL